MTVRSQVCVALNVQKPAGTEAAEPFGQAATTGFKKLSVFVVLKWYPSLVFGYNEVDGKSETIEVFAHVALRVFFTEWEVNGITLPTYVAPLPPKGSSMEPPFLRSSSATLGFCEG